MPKVLAERFGNRIHIKPAEYLGSGLFSRYLAATKQVSGVRYSKAAGCQTAMLDMEICRDLRRVFGGSLVIGPELSMWAREELSREDEVRDAQAFDPRQPQDTPIVAERAPAVWDALQNRSFQTHAPHFGRLVGNYLLADQPGLGKTLETFATLIEWQVSGAILVIAPQTSLYPTWSNEVQKWLSGTGATAWVVGDSSCSAAKRMELLREGMAHAALHPDQMTFILINAEMVRLKEQHECPGSITPGMPAACDGSLEWCPYAEEHKTTREAAHPLLFSIRWSAIVGDEVHKYLLNANPRSKKVSQVGLGFQRLKGDRRLAISGTPMRGKPRLIWPVLRWLRPDKYPGQWSWAKRYFQTEEDSWSGNEKITDRPRPEMEESFNREMSGIMLRRTKQELRALNPAWAPPEKRYAEVWVKMDAKQKRAYNSMQKAAQTRLQNGTLSANGILAEMTRLRQFASCYGDMVDGQFRPSLPSSKFDWLIGTMLPSLGITGDKKTQDGSSKIVVASQFTAMINIWAEELQRRGIDCFVLTGATPQEERARMIRVWQGDEKTAQNPRVLLLNTNAGGVSITLDAADDLVIMDETWVPDDQEQVEDRVHRTSRTDHQVTIWYVRAEETIEREIAGNNIMKDDRQKRVLDGRRGIAVAQRTLGAAVAP